jgi:hypothetical protein
MKHVNKKYMFHLADILLLKILCKNVAEKSCHHIPSYKTLEPVD